MKKLSTVIVSSVLFFALMGCGQSDGTTTSQADDISPSSGEVVSETGDVSADASVDPNNLTDDVVVIKGKTLSVLDNMNSVLDVLGKPSKKDSESAPIFSYCFHKNDIQISSVSADNSEYPYSFMFQDKNVSTARGIKVGSSADEVIAAYGEPGESIDNHDDNFDLDFTNLLYSFENDKYNLTFTISNGKVEQFLYINNDAFDLTE